MFMNLNVVNQAQPSCLSERLQIVSVRLHSASTICSAERTDGLNRLIKLRF